MTSNLDRIEMTADMLSDESGVLVFLFMYFSSPDKLMTVEELYDYIENLTHRETEELVRFALRELRKVED